MEDPITEQSIISDRKLRGEIKNVLHIFSTMKKITDYSKSRLKVIQKI